MLRMKSVILILALNTICLNTAFAWHDKTHLAIGKAAGYKKWYNLAGADITKIKAGFIEKNNHGFYGTKPGNITPQMVVSQAAGYNDPADVKGHLYGAILASLREYKTAVEVGRYAEYHIAFCAHYVGDLSQPFHNIPYDAFNKAHHITNDAIVEDEALTNIVHIDKNMYPIHLNSAQLESDLSTEIARIANISRRLAQKLKSENRDMTKEEAYVQLGHSASLLRAILKYLKEIDSFKATTFK